MLEFRTAFGFTLPLLLAVSSVAPSGVAAPAEADRVVAARVSRGGTIRERCARAGLPYPPRELFVRAFKHEGEVEVWAREGRGAFRHITTFRVTATSGTLGPKRRKGDRQVPEGCYRVAVFNPRSKFHLSLGLDYPNASDRVRSDPDHPGAEIYIHGSNRSVGCLPLGDAAIEELYLLALDVRARGEREIPVHIFPARMRGETWRGLREARPELAQFWSELEPIYAAFETKKVPPRVEVSATGAYRVTDAPTRR